MFRLTEPVIFQIIFPSSVTCDSAHFQTSFSDWSDAQETEGGQVITAAWPPPTPPAGLATLSGPEYEEPVYSFSYSQKTECLTQLVGREVADRWCTVQTITITTATYLSVVERCIPREKKGDVEWIVETWVCIWITFCQDEIRVVQVHAAS